jgi:uncharacterized protein
MTGLGVDRADLIVALASAATALVYCFKDKAFRTSRLHVLSGVGVATCVTAGWALTGFATDDMAVRPAAPQSLTFVRPVGDTLEWLQRFTAQPWPGFGTASVLGALLGAFIAAKGMGRFRWTTFANAAETKRILSGAVLMGIGGVLALGCTVGQAITGVSTLAMGSFLTFAALIVGSRQGIKYLERTV